MKTLKTIERKYYKYSYSSFTQPILTDNGRLGGYYFAVSASSEYSTSYPAYKAFDNSNSSFWCASTNSLVDQWIAIYNPQPLNITNMELTNRARANLAVRGGIIQGSNDGETWTQIKTFTNDVVSSNGVWNIDLSDNTNYYNYYRIYVTNSDVSSSYSSGIAEVKLTATQRNIVESTSTDYDFYEDIDVYKALKTTERKYYKYLSRTWSTPVLTSNTSYGIITSNLGSGTEYMLFNEGNTTNLVYTSSVTLEWNFPSIVKFNKAVLTLYQNNTYVASKYNTFYAYSNGNWVEIGNYTASGTWTGARSYDVELTEVETDKIRVVLTYESSSYGRAIRGIEFQGTEKIATESTSSDYDFYKDVDVYKALVA